MATISHLIRINTDAETAFKSVTTNDAISAWFTETDCSDWKMGSTVKWFGSTDMTINEFQKGRSLSLHVNQGGGWDGTDIRFEVEQIDNKTVVRFDQSGWPEITDHFRDCSMSWAYFLESLRLYIETGEGTPEGVASACESS